MDEGIARGIIARVTSMRYLFHSLALSTLLEEIID